MSASGLELTLLTWNIAQVPIGSIEHQIANRFTCSTSDVIGIGLQEIVDTSMLIDGACPDISSQITAGFQSALPSTYSLALSENLGSVMFLILFRKASPFTLTIKNHLNISHYNPPVTHSKASLAAQVSAVLDGREIRITIINNHLECYDEQYETRNAEWKRVLELVPLDDYAVMLGDLNYRIELDRAKVIECIEKKDFGTLIEHDQLTRAKREHPEFAVFKEGEVRFAPTYKFDKDSDQYDTSSKKRIPSYTDRILFAEREGLSPVNIRSYGSIADRLSDHRPVMATVCVSSN
jgi:endonuclease/exonuclease/phosphatase family metal-dependent hydrolase